MEQPMLPAEFPEPVLTCDLIIKRELTDAFTSQERWIDAMRESHKYKVGDKTDAAMAAQYRSLMFLQGFISSAAITDLLQTIQRMAPGLADGIARDFDNLHESGEVGELLWEWATERGLDPEQIIEETKAKIAFDKKAATPCADKSVAKGANEMRREKSAAYRETVGLTLANNPALAGLEHDIRTALPFNLTGDTIVHYVSRHLYADGYRRPEPARPLEVTEMTVDTTDRGFRALTADEVNVAMGLPTTYSPDTSIAPELTPITPEQGKELAEIADLAQYFEGVTIDGTYEETLIYASDALNLATILHAAGYRKIEGTK